MKTARSFIGKLIWAILISGLLLALLRMFDYDPFGVIAWIVSLFTFSVNAVADFFTGNDFFVDLTSKPN